jgi:hypothetical protein
MKEKAPALASKSGFVAMTVRECAEVGRKVCTTNTRRKLTRGSTDAAFRLFIDHIAAYDFDYQGVDEQVESLILTALRALRVSFEAGQAS